MSMNHTATKNVLCETVRLLVLGQSSRLLQRFVALCQKSRAVIPHRRCLRRHLGLNLRVGPLGLVDSYTQSPSCDDEGHSGAHAPNRALPPNCRRVHPHLHAS